MSKAIRLDTMLSKPKSKAVKAAQDKVQAVQGQLDKLASLVGKDEAEVANKEVTVA